MDGRLGGGVLVLRNLADDAGGVRGLEEVLEPLVVSASWDRTGNHDAAHISSYFNMSAWEYAAPTGTLGSNPLTRDEGRHGLELFDFQKGEEDLLIGPVSFPWILALVGSLLGGLCRYT